MSETEIDAQVFHPRNLTLSLIFFSITPLVIFISFFSLFSLRPTTSEVLGFSVDNSFNSKSGTSIYASLPNNYPVVAGTVESNDARSVLIKNYLGYHYSPLEPYSDFIVEISDQYNLDYRLLVAIAQQESNLCKKIPENSHNCWGWGIHSQGTLFFDSYREAITTVAEGIKRNYVDKGYTSVEDIMTKYTPLSQGSWSSGVNKFMYDIENSSEL